MADELEMYVDSYNDIPAWCYGDQEAYLDEDIDTAEPEINITLDFSDAATKEKRRKNRIKARRRRLAVEQGIEMEWEEFPWTTNGIDRPYVDPRTCWVPGTNYAVAAFINDTFSAGKYGTALNGQF